MAKTVNSKKNKAGELYMQKAGIRDYITYLLIAAMTVIYLVITDDQYFNITITRYRTLMASVLIYIILTVVAIIVDGYILRYYGVKRKLNIYEENKGYKNPEFWIMAFGLAQIFALAGSVISDASIIGEDSRYMGALTYLILLAMVFLVGMGVKLHEYVFLMLGLTSMFSFVVAIAQHMGNDFMGYRDNIAKKMFHTYVSTFGNINVFSSFLCMIIPVFACLLIFGSKRMTKIISGAVLVLGSMCVMIANSDSAYIGIGVAGLLVFIVSYLRDRMFGFSVAVGLLATGNLFITLLNKLVIKKYDQRGGITELIDKLPVAIAIFVFSILFIFIVLFVKKYVPALASLNKKKVICIFLIGLLVMCIGVVSFGIATGMEIFTFNYKWGTFRGYIWTKSAELFRDAPIKNKIFGYGNESVKFLMTQNYYDEMVKVTEKCYDNSHNELLQYLLTTGIVGVVSYIGLIISSITFILRRAKGRGIAYACVAAIVGYVAQSLINVNQAITTPLLFFFIAIGIGYARDRRNEGEKA